MSDPACKSVPRRRFLATCAPETRNIHEPIVDLCAARGHLNPAGLGVTAAFCTATGQSTVAFDTVAAYRIADDEQRSPYGGAEYGIVQTPAAALVCQKMNELHGGAGAVITPSGLNAISTFFAVFLPAGGVILMPDGAYGPTFRLLDALAENDDRLTVRRYPARATGAEVAEILREQRDAGRPANIVFLEAPGSHLYEIPDIDGVAAAARVAGARLVMDNSWASHVRFRPLRHGIDIAIQATTKYEGGYGDTPSGVIIARDIGDHRALARHLRVFGNGAVAPETCARLLHRLDSTAERLARQAATVRAIGDWLAAQPFIAEIIDPARPASPDHARLRQYFGEGNGLLTARFAPDVPAASVDAFLDRLHLVRIGESWAAHVTLALPVAPRRALDTVAPGRMVRFSAGLEDAGDLLRDLRQAAAASFPIAPTKRMPAVFA